MSNGIFAFSKVAEMSPIQRDRYFMLLKYIFNGKYRLENVDHCYCGANALEQLSVQDRFALPFGTKICRVCGLIQLSPRLTAASLANFYEEIYWGLILGESKELSTGSQRIAREIYNYLFAHIVPRKGKLSIIEVGCGSGIKLAELKDLFLKDKYQIEAIGCDYSSDAVARAKAKGLRVCQGGIEALFGEKADLIILSHVVEHFVDLKAELLKIKNLLNPGAFLYIEVPGVCDLANKKEYGCNYLDYTVMAHIYNFNLTSLRSILEPFGFKFVSGDEYIRSIFQDDPSHVFSLDVSENYRSTIEYLKKAEKKHEKLTTGYKYRLKNCARSIVRECLNLVYHKEGS